MTCANCPTQGECTMNNYCYKVSVPKRRPLYYQPNCNCIECRPWHGVPDVIAVPQTLSDNRVAKFDDAIKVVTDQRGSVYGHPKHDFGRADRLKAVVAECQDPLARHALEMICVKVARLIQTPTHLDSWIDIAGYARTGVMVTDADPAASK